MKPGFTLRCVLIAALWCPRFGAAATRKDLGPLLSRVLAHHDVPGMVAAVVRGDQVVAIGAAGVRCKGNPAKISTADQFHIGSCTKSMTATLCAMLVEDGKLSWETTVSDVFPQLKEKMDPQYRVVTLRQLLCHRGGAPQSLDANGLWARLWTMRHDPVLARQTLTQGVLTQPPQAPPGTQYIYSNAGFAIAGHMAEKVTGKPWEKLMQERLFAPLQMRSAGFGAPGQTGQVDQPWGHRADGTPISPGPEADNPPAIGPAGTVHCTVSDWAKYISLHLEGAQGHPRLLTAKSFKTLHTPAAGEDYAFGWIVTRRGWGGSVLTHAGSNTMWYCVCWLAPQKNFAVLVMCNQGGDDAEKACDEVSAQLVTDPLVQQR